MNKEIYFKIYTYMTIAILDPTKSTSLVIELDKDLYVSIFRRSDGDIDVSHYKDKDCEIDIDGGGVIDMVDEGLIDDMRNELLEIDVESISKYITDKSLFAYELVFTG